jgi:hypothetical protein
VHKLIPISKKDRGQPIYMNLISTKEDVFNMASLILNTNPEVYRIRIEIKGEKFVITRPKREEKTTKILVWTPHYPKSKNGMWKVFLSTSEKNPRKLADTCKKLLNSKIAKIFKYQKAGFTTNNINHTIILKG